MGTYLWQERGDGDSAYGYVFNRRPDGLSMIVRPPALALDVGCGLGGVGAALRERFPQCRLWGCERNAAAARAARQHFDHVIEQDVETADFAALGLQGKFDLVCFFDVLEHLVNPWKLLHVLLPNVTDDAHLLVSLPNVANLPLLADAASGRWQYQRWGLLDFTHLRFFSDFDARSMFYQTGYRVLEHRAQMFARGLEVFKTHRDGTFPRKVTLGPLSVEVESLERLALLCADQNLYRISPHHGRFADDGERRMAFAQLPPVLALGGS